MQKTVQWAYAFGSFDPIPSEFRKAWENRNNLAQTSAQNKSLAILFWNERLKTKKKRVQKKISFGEVTANRNGGDLGDLVVSPPQPINDTIGREIISGPLIEKFIHNLITHNPYWDKSPCGTSQSLTAHLTKYSITLKQLTEDLKFILSKIRRALPAILGYKSSWKLKPEYDILRLCPLYNTWVNTGQKAPIAPKLRMYLIRVVKDTFTAATSIQTAWRRRKAYVKRAALKKAALPAVLLELKDIPKPMSDITMLALFIQLCQAENMLCNKPPV